MWKTPADIGGGFLFSVSYFGLILASAELKSMGASGTIPVFHGRWIGIKWKILSSIDLKLSILIGMELLQ
jgi:hypothetical protein